MNSVLPLLLVLLINARVVLACDPGKYLYDGACHPCPRGTFQDERNQRGCKPCPGNTVATKAASTSCRDCGKFGTAAQFKHECRCMEGSFHVNGLCRVCPPGTAIYGLADRNGGYTCKECDVGYFQAKFGAKECTHCPPGTTSKQGGTKCLACADYQWINKDERCVNCPPGSGRKDDKCRKCEPNQFKTDRGYHPCLPCPPGTFSHRGASRCKRCPTGTRLMRKGECGTCRAGQRYDALMKTCVKCEVNTFIPYSNIRDKCFTCSGDKAAVEGSTRCQQCGVFQVPHKNGTCVECPGGSIYDPYKQACRRCGANEFARDEKDYCQTCSDGSFAFPGSTSCFTCPRGQALVLTRRRCGVCSASREYDKYGAVCKRCKNGFFKPETSIIPCSSCARGTVSNANRTACIPE